MMAAQLFQNLMSFPLNNAQRSTNNLYLLSTVNCHLSTKHGFLKKLVFVWLMNNVTGMIPARAEAVFPMWKCIFTVLYAIT